MCPCPSPLFAHVVRKQTHTHTHVRRKAGKHWRTLTHKYKRRHANKQAPTHIHTHTHKERGKRQPTDVVLFGWNWQLPSARACRQQVYQKYVCHFCCSPRPRLPPALPLLCLCSGGKGSQLLLPVFVCVCVLVFVCVWRVTNTKSI